MAVFRSYRCRPKAWCDSYDAGSFDWSVESNGLNDDGLLLDAGGLPASLVGETLTDYGGYAQILYGFKKGWVAGLARRLCFQRSGCV